MARDPERSLYLHLPRHHAAQERRSTPFTPAIQIADALLAAVDELTAETLEARITRYARAAAIVREGMHAADVVLLLPPALRSNTLTAARLPPGVSYPALHDALKREGFVIYAGQAQFADVAFRVANMGAIDERDLHRFVRALAAALA
jgi:2-aminoethylphosphonate-pyruvate transaminase